MAKMLFTLQIKMEKFFGKNNIRFNQISMIEYILFAN